MLNLILGSEAEVELVSESWLVICSATVGYWEISAAVWRLALQDQPWDELGADLTDHDMRTSGPRTNSLGVRVSIAAIFGDPEPIGYALQKGGG